MKLPLPQQLSWRSWQRVGLIIPRSPVRSRSKAYVLPDSLGGQDTRLSPERPGFNSRSGNFFSYRSIELTHFIHSDFYFKKLIEFTENYTLYKQLKSRLTNAGVA